jgi:hypothetical protein
LAKCLQSWQQQISCNAWEAAARLSEPTVKRWLAAGKIYVRSYLMRNLPLQ